MAQRNFHALTVKQPWASLIACGVKLWENREWSPLSLCAGDYFAIHAGSSVESDEWNGAAITLDIATPINVLPQDRVRWMRPEYERTGNPSFADHRAKAVPYGAIIAVVRFGGITTEDPDDPFWCGPVGWKLDEVVAIEPYAIPGQRGLWKVENDVRAIIGARWKAAQAA